MKLTSVFLVEGDYKILEELAKITNGLWNKAVHLEREKLKEGKFAFYAELCNTLKNDPLYQLLPSQTAQAVLQKLDGALRSYVKLKRSGRKARIPGYHKPKTAWIVPYKTQQFRFEGDTLKLTLSTAYRREKGAEWLTLKTYGKRREGKAKYLELYPRGGLWFASVVSEFKPTRIKTHGNITIDLGIVNQAATWNGEKSELYKGGEVSAIIRYRGKENGRLQAVLATHKEKTSKAKKEMNRRLTGQARHAVHALTKTLVEKAVQEKKGIIVGNLTGILDQKRSRKANQKLHSWMFRLMIFQLGYKCRLAGVPFRTKSEKNTSRNCVVCHIKHRGGRIHRGLYRCKLHGQYNADSGAAYNLNVSPIPAGVGVVAALAQPAVALWNGHRWLSRDETNPLNREEPHTL